MSKTFLKKALDDTYIVFDDIFESIERKVDDFILIESYEELSYKLVGKIKELYKNIGVEWNKKIKELIKKQIYTDTIKIINPENDDNFEPLLDYLKLYSKTDRHILEFYKNMFDENYKKYIKIKKVDIDLDSVDDNSSNDSDDECLDNNDLENEMKDNLTNFKWRKNQEDAIQTTELQEFKSGVHNQIMGSGKSNIILTLPQRHYNTYKNNNIYLIICQRQDILRQLIFDENELVDKTKKKFLKNNEIIDLDNFVIVEKIFETSKKSKEIKKHKDKPTLAFVNTDFLRSIHAKNLAFEETNKLYFDYNDINFVLVDECHSISANKLYDILFCIKYQYKKHIIGFSATPLRDGAETKLINIFSDTLDETCKTKKLNIISTYDCIQAIKDGIILPPDIKICQVNKTVGKRIGRGNKDLIEKKCRIIFKDLPYKKIICWCKTIKQMILLYDWFKSNDFFKQFTIYCSSSKDKDYANKYDTNYLEFYESKGNSILLCVNRFREGSDIPLVDMGMYLDYVSKRSFLVSMQTSGRIMRPDPKGKKKNAIIFDTFIKKDNEDINILTAEKVITYLIKLFNISMDPDNKKKSYMKLCKLVDNIKYDEKTKELSIRIDENIENNVKINIMLSEIEFNWSKLLPVIQKFIDEKTNIDNMTKLKLIIEKLKKMDIFDEYTDFWEEYENIKNKNLLGLPKDLYKEFKDIFDKTSWYELFGWSDNYYKTLDECKTKLKKICGNILITREKYGKLCKQYEKLPPNPQEMYKNENFTTIENEFDFSFGIKSKKVEV